MGHESTEQLPIAGLRALAMTALSGILTETMRAGLLSQIASSLKMSQALACQMIKEQRQAVLAVINTIFVQESAEAASAQWCSVADQLRTKFPKLADMMDTT